MTRLRCLTLILLCVASTIVCNEISKAESEAPAVPVPGPLPEYSPFSMEKKMQLWKLKVGLPPKNIQASLDRRVGLAEDQASNLHAILPLDSYKKAAATAEIFWKSALLTSIVGIGRKSNIADSDFQTSDWVSYESEDNPGVIFEKNDSKGSPDVTTVFLSEAGFSKMQSSVEIVPASGRDLLASVPVADFCERSPGKRIPYNFSIRFSPWDFASKLVASSRLDVSLLELVLQPDGLRALTNDNEDQDEGDQEGDDDDDDDGEDLDDEQAVNLEMLDQSDAGGWDVVLRQLKPQIVAGTLTIAQLAAKIRRDQGVEQRIRRLILAAAIGSPDFKKICGASGGQWREISWTKDQWLEFFSCRNNAGKTVGPSFRIEDGNFKDGEIEFFAVSGRVKITALVGGGRTGMTTQMLVDDKPVGADVWFSSTGSVLATEEHSGSRPSAIVFGVNGQGKWSRANAVDTTIKNRSWYDDGAVKSFVYAPVDGDSSVMVGYHKNGVAKYWLPIRAGRVDGKFKWWHPSGKVAGELDFASGKRFGSGRLYYESGSEGFRADYSEDVPHGRLIWRDTSGNPLFSLGFTGGKANGALDIRYAGRQMVEARFEAGAVEGTVRLRNTRGILVAEIPYRGGLLNGTVILRDSGGAIRVKSNWLDGQADGVTEASYSSGLPAANCKFKDGSLEEWKSFDPGSKLRYLGKVTSLDSGIAEIDYFGGSNKVVLNCTSKEWAVESCVLIHGDKKINFPTLKDLLRKIDDAGELEFKPEKCGGALRALDVTPFVDHTTGVVEVAYRTQEMCPSDSLATGMQCDVSCENGKWTPAPCVLADDDLGEEIDD
jgi:antitoxin component YwqK of YwqJK toxin-antitoxin module